MNAHYQDVTEVAFHELYPTIPPIVMLAQQLYRMEIGMPTAIIFSYAKELPQQFDPYDPPPGIGINSAFARLLDRFYRLRTTRECPVMQTDPVSRLKRRCPYISTGFRDIVSHQYTTHHRECHYLCLIENCLACFDKLGNAKRHFAALHSTRAVQRREDRRGEERGVGHTGIQDAIQYSMQQAHSSRHGTPYSIQQAHSSSYGTPYSIQQAHSSSHGTPYSRIPIVPMDQTHVTFSRSFQSSVVEDLENKVVYINVSKCVAHLAGIALLEEQSNMEGGFLQERQGRHFGEWVAVTGLLDLHYQPAKVVYRFG